MITNQDMSANCVAFFDFDGTLTRRDTLMPFLKFTVGKPTFYFKLLLISPILIAYFLRLIRNDVAKQIVLRFFLSGSNSAELMELGERFSKEIIPLMLREEGMNLLRWHQKQGHKCVLVSASLDIYLGYWAKYEGFNAFLTSSLSVDTHTKAVTGMLSGQNCYGAEKSRRAKLWLGHQPFKVSSTFGYGDTKGDYELLKFVDNPKILRKNKFIEFKI